MLFVVIHLCLTVLLARGSPSYQIGSADNYGSCTCSCHACTIGWGNVCFDGNLCGASMELISVTCYEGTYNCVSWVSTWGNNCIYTGCDYYPPILLDSTTPQPPVAQTNARNDDMVGMRVGKSSDYSPVYIGDKVQLSDQCTCSCWDCIQSNKKTCFDGNLCGASMELPTVSCYEGTYNCVSWVSTWSGNCIYTGCDSYPDVYDTTNAIGFMVTSGEQYCQVDNNRCMTDGAGRYGNSERCTFTFNGEAVLYMKHFDLEWEKNCVYDYIKVNDQKYCGSEFEGILVNGHTEFTFQSDGSVAREGFTLCYTQWQ